MSKRIVTIGGGKGQSALLRELRAFKDVHLSAIVSTFDNGGSTGILRDERGIVAVGDVRRCFAALAGERLEEEWNARDEQGHAQGNLILADAIEQHGTLLEALDEMQVLYDPAGRVIPVSEDPAELIADLGNTTLVGEESIDTGEERVGTDIDHLRLNPADVRLSEAATEAVTAADMIVLTMGDLYTSLLPNLLVAGLSAAILARGVPVVYVCNRTTKPGETDGYAVSDFVRALKEQGGLTPTDICVDAGDVPVPPGFDAVEDDADTLQGVRVHRADMSSEAEPHLISARKAANVLHRLCTS